MASTVVVSISMALAFVFTVAGLLSFGRGIFSMTVSVRGGAAETSRTGQWHKRLWNTVIDILTHRAFLGRPVVRAAHWLVMVSFVLLVLTLARSYLQIRNPRANLPILGGWAPWSWITEIFAWAGTFGILALIFTRWMTQRRNALAPRESRFYGSTRWQAYFVELVILVVCLCVILLHGLDFAFQMKTGWPATWVYFPTTFWLGAWFSELSVTTVANLIVIVSTLKVMVSMLWMAVVGVHISMSISWHRFLAPINLFARRDADGSKSLGPLIPVLVDGHPTPNLLEADDDAVIGLGSTEDHTWKDRLDFYSCTECGRCQDVCPAWNTNKPLSPKLLTLALRDNVTSAGQVDVTQQVAPADAASNLLDTSVNINPSSADVLGALSAAKITGPAGVAAGDSALVPDVVSADLLWDCTMCGACVEQCPVDIEHVDRIANLRRFQVLMESAFPRELARPFKGMETRGNPYNQAPRKRLDWAKDLDFPIPVIGEDVEDATGVDYLFWVGCAGAYDDRQKRTSAAIAELLHVAGVSFAVLGSAESCTGDPARRAGNEVLYQMLAEAAIETIDDAAAKRIIVSCAHCFNTIGNEFPQLGGNFEVIHHTQVLNRLVRDGLLTPAAPPDDETRDITYHDPCFLGRHNRVFTPPRELLGGIPGLKLVEMPRNMENALCCGAGGARAWMEETRGTRIADARMTEAASTGAATVATACPFCTQMLDTAADPADGSSQPVPEVKDVALLLLEGVRRSQEQNRPHQ